MHALYKQGKLSEREYYYGMTDAVLKYSALEFLGLKAMFEIKKSLNRMNNPSSAQIMSTGVSTENAIGSPSSRPRIQFLRLLVQKAFLVERS